MKYNLIRTSIGIGSAGILGALAYCCAAAFVQAQAFNPISSQAGAGSTGVAVSALQRFLASDPAVYPQGLVTGYYGPLTADAVTNFQIGYALPAVGRVGPLTLAALNGLIASGQQIDVSSPVISNVSVNAAQTSATFTWTTDEMARGKVYYDRAPITGSDATQSKMEPTLGALSVADQSFGTAKSILVTGLSANTTYYYIVESTDQSGNVSVSTQGSFRTAI